MAPRKAAAPVPSDPVKSEGLALVSGLSGAVEALEVKTAEDYLSADELLGRVRSARRKWDLKMETILEPLKETVASAKKALASGKALHDEIDAPLEAMETGLKGAMRDYKLEETRQIEAGKEATRKETERLLREETLRKQQVEGARTPQMRARFGNALKDVQAQVQEVAEAKPALKAIKGATSTSRRVRKVRLVDEVKLIQAWAMDSEAQHMLPGLVVVDTGALSRLDLDLAAALPGVEVYWDIVIAGR